MNQREEIREPLCEAPIRFAIIGCGRIGLRHIEAIESTPKAKLVALCDIKEHMEVLDAGFPSNLPYFRSEEDLFSFGIKIDAVCICVPNAYHTPIAIRALRRGIHVVMEKPVVLSMSDGERLLMTSETTGKQVFSVLQNRYTPSIIWLRNLVLSGKLGEIYALRMNCLWNRDQRYYTKESWHGDARLDGGTLYTQYLHFLDFLLWTFGDIEVDHASFYDFNHQELTDFEDSGNIDFHIKGKKTVGNIFYSTAVHEQNLEVSLTVLAEHGTIRLGGNYLNKVEHCSLKDTTPPETPAPKKGENNYGYYSGSAANHKPMIQQIVTYLLGGKATISTLEDGLRAVELINRIYEHKQA